MSLVKREPSPAQIEASRANSRLSTGPRSARGKAVLHRNFLKRRPFSQIIAHSLRALGERPGDLDQMIKAMSAAMLPRDAWEGAWVQDIAILRWRLERVQRAEAGSMGLRRRKFWCQRQREALPPSGVQDLGDGNMIGILGFTGMKDSPAKFQQVLEYLHQLRCIVAEGQFEEGNLGCFNLLYGKGPRPQPTLLRASFERLVKHQAEGNRESLEEGQKSLLADLDKEISNYEQLAALYAAEHVGEDPVQQDADLLLPGQDLDTIIRYETHLEDLVERKLRQFYARRRELNDEPRKATKFPKLGTY